MTLSVQIRKKHFESRGNTTRVLANVEFDVPESSITCVYGPSGCGKSTALKIIAGLDRDFEGEVVLDGHPVQKPTQSIGMVVQTQVTYDWLTVGENMTFGLRYSSESRLRGLFGRLLGGVDPDIGKSEAVRLAKLVGLAESDLAKYPTEISGGMKQRMAFGRALVLRPRVLLLDEPFSSLDYESRQALQDAVLRARDQAGVSFVCVSHDPEEVLYLAQQVVILGNQPATVVEIKHPKLALYGNSEMRYTLDFQLAKRELQEKLYETNGRSSSESDVHPESTK